MPARKSTMREENRLDLSKATAVVTGTDSPVSAETGKTQALLVMPEDRRWPLLTHLLGCGFEVVSASDCETACRILRRNPGVQVVLADLSLPDGDWTLLLNEIPATSTRPEIIICMRLADPGAWIDALEAGAYDVLVEPYQRAEIRRIVESAAARTLLPSRPDRRTGFRARALAS